MWVLLGTAPALLFDATCSHSRALREPAVPHLDKRPTLELCALPTRPDGPSTAPDNNSRILPCLGRIHKQKILDGAFFSAGGERDYTDYGITG